MMEHQENKKREVHMDSLEVIERVETIIEEWQAYRMDSDEALKQITTLIDKEV